MAENKRPGHENHGHSEVDFAPDLSKPENRHETQEIDVWVIGKFAIGLTLTAIFCIALMVGLFFYFLHREGGEPPTRVASPTADARQLPPEPRLEEMPARDLQEMREAEDQLLTTYGMLDRANGVVRLPIDRAMDLIAQQGLPTRAQLGPQSAASNVSVPMESGLGLKAQQVDANMGVAQPPAKAPAKPAVPLQGQQQGQGH